VAYQEIGDALSGKGRRLEALDLYRKDLAITRQLAQSDPDRMEWQRDLMTSLDRLGSALFDDQPAGEWLVLYREAITISARIAGHDASRVDWQHDEAMMRQKLADRLRKTNQLDEALTAYRESLEIRKKLAALPSIPPDWDGELTQNYQHIGAILLDQGKPNDALALAEGRLELVRAIRSGASPPLALASALGNVGWYGIFAGAFQRAIIASEEAIALAPDLLWLRANRAHALMFSGAIAAARSEYLAHKGELLDVALKKTWEASVAEDFGIFRKASLASPLMDEMERSWSRQGRDDGALRSP
jgi:tetratricopeptide (TPR) repeat protein